MSLPFTCIERLFRWMAIFTVFASALPAFGQSIEKVLMPGAVIEGHAKYEQKCKSCHLTFDKEAQSRLCQDCHKEIAQDILGKKRLHGRLDNLTCRNCHSEHKGRQASIVNMDRNKFDHGTTEFKLLGSHKEVKCEGCHLPKIKFRDAPKLCNDCHKKDDADKGHKGHLGGHCENCHNEKNWTQTRFDHEKTKFSLLGGKHLDVKCKGCHVDKTFQKTPLTCVGCHRKDDDDKGHKGNFGAKCHSCHNDKGWKETTFNHDLDTHFVLRGKHKPAKCADCHLPEKGDIFHAKLSTVCVGCHKKDDQEKGHRGKLGEKCDSCHNERDWKTTAFDHDQTKFPLLDKHKDVKCESCHKGGVSGTKATIKLGLECVSCHRKVDDDKGHRGRYGDKCETCHNAKGWKPSVFNHGKDTKYPLRGRHSETKCDSCHLPERGQLYKTKWETTCVACHKNDDKHKGQLGSACESCHDEKKWTGVPFDHNKSRFSLTGSHAKVECKKCHLTPEFHDAPSACNRCHEKDDKHKGRFGSKCESCHYTGTWKSWDFDHSKTSYSLDGAHRKVDCYGCHTEATSESHKPGKTCFTCHANDDIHDGGFGSQCDRCHVSAGWKRVRH